MNVDLIKNLKRHSTLGLMGLILITLGVYYGHFISRQSKRINELIPEGQEKIPSMLPTSVLVLGYVILLFSVAIFFVSDKQTIALVTSVLHYIWLTCLCVWSLIAGRRMNMLNSAEEGSEVWFHGFWGMFYTPLYFNFKVTQLNERLTETTRSRKDPSTGSGGQYYSCLLTPEGVLYRLKK